MASSPEKNIFETVNSRSEKTKNTSADKMCKPSSSVNDNHEETSTTENIILGDVNCGSDPVDGNESSKSKKKKKHKTMEETDEQELKLPTDKFPLETVNSVNETENENKRKKRKKKKKSRSEEEFISVNHKLVTSSTDDIILDEVNSANEMENGKHRKRKKRKRSRTVEESIDSDEETCIPFTSVKIKHEVTSLTENIVDRTNSENEKKNMERKKEKISRNEEEFIGYKTFTPQNDNHEVTSLTENILDEVNTGSDLDNEKKSSKRKKHKKSKISKQFIISAEEMCKPSSVNNNHEETSTTENIILDDVNSVSDPEDGNKYSKRKKKKKHKTVEETDKQALKPPTDKFPLDTMNSEDGKKSSKRKKKKKSKTKEFIDSSSLNEHHEATSLTEGAPADVNVVDANKNVLVKKPIIPLWVPDEVSEIIHGTNTLNETLKRNSRYLLQNFGIRVRKGLWTPEEDRILKKNYKRALKDICKDDRKYILCITRESPFELQRRIRDIMWETRFYSKLGKNLNRTPNSCLRRAKHIFQKNKVSGRFTEEEKQELERLVDEYGHQWRKIGRMMGRSADSVSAFYYQIRSKGGKGRFSDLERQQLCEAVEDVMKKYNIPSDQYQYLPWAEIASKVPTRTVRQCKKHWFVHYLAFSYS